MELRPGYKQTEVGVIPEDWDVILLSEACRSISDGTHFTPRYVAQGIPFYSVENVTANDFVNTKYISEAEHKSLIKRCKPERGDILMTRITAGILGDTRIIDWDVNASIYVSLALLKPNNRIYPEYLYRYTKSKTFLLDVERGGLVNATPKKINMQEIGSIPIPVPKYENEQRAIAAVLSDVDALIAGLEKLIVKKRDLKQAAMQQLLTGQTRLPGFSGAWEVKRLDEVAEVDPDNLSASTDPQYSFRYIALENVDRGTLVSYSEQILSTAPSRARRKLQTGDVLVSTVRPNLQSHLLFSELQGDWVCSTGFSVVRCRSDRAMPAYLYAHLFANGVKRQIDELLTGSNYPAINSGDVRALKITFPSVEEQTAIATVLSDMDAELAKLEARLAKTRALKQGMMQELLTGRTRLI